MPFRMIGLRDVGGKYSHTEMVWDDIASLRTPFLADSLQLFSQWKTLGALPHGKGTLAEKQTVVDILMILSQEVSGYERFLHEDAIGGMKAAKGAH